MSWDSETAVRYIERADELRCIADRIKDRESRETLLKVAADYERMAQVMINRKPGTSPPDGRIP